MGICSFKGENIMDATDAIINQAIGFVIGLVSSFVFWYLLLTLKPKLSISPEAAHDVERKRLRIKIVNNGWRQVADIQASLTVIERHKSGESFKKSIKKRISLQRDT